MSKAPDMKKYMDKRMRLTLNAKRTVTGQLRGFDQDKVASLYADLRRESASSGGIPIAVRHIESIMRMSEAHARMHLRTFVREDDIDAAISIMLTSFIDSQKFSVRRALRKGFKKYISTENDKTFLILHALGQLVKQNATYLRMRNEDSENVSVFMDELEQKAKDMNIFDLDDFYKSKEFSEAGYQIDRNTKTIWKIMTAQ